MIISLRQWYNDDDILQLQMLCLQFIFNVHIAAAFSVVRWPTVNCTEWIRERQIDS